MGDWDFNDSEFKKAVLKNSQWDTRKLRKSVSSGIKSINKINLPKKIEKTNRNAGAEEHSKWNEMKLLN